MRNDMDKVIVERSRHGRRQKSAEGYRKRWQQTPPDEWPQRENIFAHKGRTKYFNEHLGPLRRYLAKQVGRPWNNVFADICENLRLDSVVQSHVRDHIFDYVELDVEEIDGEPHYRSGWRRGRPIEAQRWLVLYVCPRTGLLHSAKPRKQQPPTRINVNDSLQYHMLDGAWYEVRLCKIPEETDRRWDVIFDKPLNHCPLEDLTARYGIAVYALSKRKLSASEKRTLMRSHARRDN